MTARSILRTELSEAMQDLEEKVSELPGVDSEEVAAFASRAGNSALGASPRPKGDDCLGTSRYAVEFLTMLVDVASEQERRIAKLEGKAGSAGGASRKK